MNKIDEAVSSALTVMIMILRSDVTAENGSKLLKLHSGLEKIGAHDMCEYYKSDIENYICNLQKMIHEG